MRVVHTEADRFGLPFHVLPEPRRMRAPLKMRGRRLHRRPRAQELPARATNRALGIRSPRSTIATCDAEYPTYAPKSSREPPRASRRARTTAPNIRMLDDPSTQSCTRNPLACTPRCVQLLVLVRLASGHAL